MGILAGSEWLPLVPVLTLISRENSGASKNDFLKEVTLQRVLSPQTLQLGGGGERSLCGESHSELLGSWL